MASERQRWIGHLDLFLHAKNRPTEALDLPGAIGSLIKCKLIGTPAATITGPRWILQLSELKLLPSLNVAVALFLGIDRERAEAVYGNTKTFSLRTASKLADEGGAVSTHLVMSTKVKKGSNRYRAVLEEVEGLSRSRVIPFFRALLTDNVVFNETLASGDQRQIEPHLATNVILDKPIGEQLDEGRLLSVELIRKPGSGVIDSKLEYYEKLRLIRYIPKSTSRGETARKIVRKIRGTQTTAEYPEIRIRIKEDDSDRQRTVHADSRKGDALATAFQLRTLIDQLNPPLKEATVSVVPHLISKMAEALAKR